MRTALLRCGCGGFVKRTADLAASGGTGPRRCAEPAAATAAAVRPTAAAVRPAGARSEALTSAYA